MKPTLLTLCVLMSVLTSSAMAQRDVPRDRNAQERGGDFVPQNDRERALFEMIQQLRAEVASLQRQLQARSEAPAKIVEDNYRSDPAREGDRPRDSNRQRERDRVRVSDRPRDGDLPRDGDRAGDYDRSRDRDQAREGDAPRESYPRGDRDPRVRPNPLLQKVQRIFAAYDKNKDRHVSFEEWLAMREGAMTEERKDRERRHFAEPAGDDKKITLEEFFRWTERRSRGGSREGDARQQPRRDRE